MFALRFQGSNGCMSISRVDAKGYVYTGYNIKVWKTRTRAKLAMGRIAHLTPEIVSLIVLYECDKNGRKIKSKE